LAHDLDDGLRVGLITEEILNNSRSFLWGRVFKKAKKEVGLKDRDLLYRRAVRHPIEYCNIEVIEETLRNIKNKNVESVENARRLFEPVVNFSLKERKNFDNLQNIIYKEVYKHPDVLMMVEKGKEILRSLFSELEKNSKLLPREIQEKIEKRENKLRLICDYVSGMTDRYAMDIYEMPFQPRIKILSHIGRR
jgi:dGTPase